MKYRFPVSLPFSLFIEAEGSFDAARQAVTDIFESEDTAPKVTLCARRKEDGTFEAYIFDLPKCSAQWVWRQEDRGDAMARTRRDEVVAEIQGLTEKKT